MSLLDSDQVQLGRRMWQALEPYHAVTYFAPESREATTELGAKGGWMSYFALRAAPLGAVPAEVVTATFYNFHPSRVARAIPAAWQAAAPARYLAARTDSVDTALRRLLGPAIEAPELADAAELAREAALMAPTCGRAMAAANMALEWPSEPHLVLWHGQTVLRESRGDGHVAALVTAALDPCETLVMFAAEGRAGVQTLRDGRGWSVDEWTAAEERLLGRGLLDAGAELTDDGLDLRRWVEERTDLAAAPSWQALGQRRCERLAELVGPYVDLIIENGGFAADNPMGLAPLKR